MGFLWRRSTSSSSGCRASRSSRPPRSDRAEPRHHAAEIQPEGCLGEEQFQFRQNDQRAPDGLRVVPQPVAELQQDTMDLAQFLLGQPHQFVVQLDGF